MQAALHLGSSSFIPLQSASSSKTLSLLKPSFSTTTKYNLLPPSLLSVKVAAIADSPQVDYSSMTSSVFPAEACETLGGVACDVEMFPESKPKSQPKATVAPTSETVDREYLDYTSPKTVFIAEACDDLGGEFCEPDYQTGVH